MSGGRIVTEEERERERCRARREQLGNDEIRRRLELGKAAQAICHELVTTPERGDAYLESALRAAEDLRELLNVYAWGMPEGESGGPRTRYNGNPVYGHVSRAQFPGLEFADMFRDAADWLEAHQNPDAPLIVWGAQLDCCAGELVLFVGRDATPGPDELLPVNVDFQDGRRRIHDESKG